MVTVRKVIEFDWDKGNIGKNLRHKVEDREAEEPFFDKGKKTFKDHVHSGKEERFRIIGRTRRGRLLFVAFTRRRTKFRIISARDTNRKEVWLYEEKTSTTKV